MNYFQRILIQKKSNISERKLLLAKPAKTLPDLIWSKK